MNLYKYKKIFSVSLLVCAVIISIGISAFAQVNDEMPSYLKFESPYVISKNTPKDLFVETLLEKELCEDKGLEPDPATSTKYISLCAVKSALDEYETIPSVKDSKDLEDALLKGNGFEKSSSLSGCEIGDIVFYNDCPGVVVEKDSVLFLDVDANAFLMKVKDLDGAFLIKVIYPYYEQLAMLYMTNDLGYSRPVSIGILANLHAESLCDPACLESSNQMGFGIAQWSKDRRLDLDLYCAENSRNIYSLYTQLDFIDHEMDTREDLKGLKDELENVTQDEDGAYDAAFLFCNIFENPVDATNASIDRGTSVMDTFYPLYGGIDIPK